MTGVSVHLESASRNYVCETEYDGSFAIRVAPGTYRLYASLHGWHMQGKPRVLIVAAGAFLIRKDITMIPPKRTLAYSNSPITNVANYCE